MARKRMIDPGFWTDEKLGTCTRDERLLFMGLISNADDEGRLQGHTALLKSIIFPYDLDINPTDVETWLTTLAGKKMITRYQVDGQAYISINKFDKYQIINKPTPSRLPAPTVEVDGILPEDYRSTTVVLPPNRIEKNLKEEKEVEVNAREGKTTTLPRPQQNYSLCKIFEQNFGRLLGPMESQEINTMADEHSQELVEYALKVAILNNARSIKYIQTILNGWHAKGFTTVFEVQAYEERREQLKQGIDTNKAEVDKSISLADAKAEKEQKRRAEVIQAAINYITLVEKLPPNDPQAIEYAKGYDDAIPGVSVDIIAELQKMGGLAHGIN